MHSLCLDKLLIYIRKDFELEEEEEEEVRNWLKANWVYFMP